MKSRDGFAAAIVIFIVLALVVIGGIAYVHYVYLPRMAAQNNSLASASSLSTASSSEFSIPQWSVEFQIPSDLADLVYTVSDRQGQAAVATFSTKELENLAPSCTSNGGQGIGTLSRWLYSATDTTAGVHIGEYTYAFIEPTGNCAEPGYLPGGNFTITTATQLYSQESSKLETAILDTLTSISGGATQTTQIPTSSTPKTQKATSSGATNGTAPSQSQNQASFSCSYEDASDVGVILHASFPSYINPSNIVALSSGVNGGNAMVGADASSGLFCVKTEKASVNLVSLQDSTNGYQILAVISNPQKGAQYTIDANSTAVAVFFVLPEFSFYSSNVAAAPSIIQTIENDQSISAIAEFVQSTPNYADELTDTNNPISNTFISAELRIPDALPTGKMQTAMQAIHIISPASGDTWSASANAQDEIDYRYQNLDPGDQSHLYLQFPDGTECDFEDGPLGGAMQGTSGDMAYVGTSYVILSSMGCAGSTQRPNLAPGQYSLMIVVEDNNNVLAVGKSASFNINQ